ncbi:PepSY-like domain-containing protein (plasmid) [Adhaeribacter swui]|uniref:PepSY-like domain-containing protein n=1 Tax=Adhaeribacter swui TaxID=2086471 RepID=A0A7G7G221_9BACT|nr:PepSY-like domain-containing protein [Adhaeribacter swui]QNF31205.1 PepSY-like domain-containing protein [Adhaeribacter swui]
MKKLLVLISSIVALSACTPDTQSQKVPKQIVAAFQKIHPEANITQWNDESPIWEAKYKNSQEIGAVSFNPKGEVVETELEIDDSQLTNQTAILEYIHSKYPKEEMQSIEKITKQDGNITYEIQITGKELVFDSQGNFLEEELD